MGAKMRSRLIRSALLYNLDAHRANPANLIAGAVGMIVNNVIFLAGLWAMLFAGKPTNDKLLPYYLSLICVVTTSYGLVNFFAGGLRWLGALISDGGLEPLLATPRDPVLLAGLSRSQAVSLGDLAMGTVGLAFVAMKLGVWVGLECAAATAISALAFAALFIACGSLSFFIPRGNQVGDLVIEMTISLSVYPTSKMFAGSGRWLLLLTPAALTAILPLEAVEKAGAGTFLLALSMASLFFWLSLLLFRVGVRRYQSVSLTGVSA